VLVRIFNVFLKYILKTVCILVWYIFLLSLIFCLLLQFFCSANEYIYDNCYRGDATKGVYSGPNLK